MPRKQNPQPPGNKDHICPEERQGLQSAGSQLLLTPSGRTPSGRTDWCQALPLSRGLWCTDLQGRRAFLVSAPTSRYWAGSWALPHPPVALASLRTGGASTHGSLSVVTSHPVTPLPTKVPHRQGCCQWSVLPDFLLDEGPLLQRGVSWPFLRSQVLSRARGTSGNR